MDYNVNVPGEEGLQQGTVPQYQYEVYAPVYKKPWFWIAIAAVVLAAAAITAVLLISGGAPPRYELTGNAGVVAAYDFYCSQQQSQDKLTSSEMKELGRRLKNEPFEIECTANVGLDGLQESSLPIRNIGFGIYAKYDLKDFGVRVGSMGMDVISGYLIDDKIVVSLMGRTGSTPVKLPQGVNIKKNMGFEERIKAFLPFLPEDEVYLSLLEKFAHSVPDKYTTEGASQTYSPKDDKEVRMDAVTTTLDSKAIKEVITGFADEVKNDKKLLRQLQDIIDKFTEFAGLESENLDDIIKELEGSADSEALKDMKVSWSVYKRNGSLVGISLEFSAKDTNVKYTYMIEYDGNNSFMSTTTDVNGTKSETVYKYNWQGGKMKMSGEMNTIVSEGTGNTTQLIDATIEYSKNGGNEYILTGDITIEGDVYNDILNSGNSMSFDMKIDAAVTVGGGLGTLKEDRQWNSIYDKEWGSMGDVFSWLFPSSNFFDYDIGNKL